MDRVFISYSHDSRTHMDAVLDLSNRLRREGVDCRIDQYEESPPEGWPAWCTNQVEEANFVLVVCTATYERRFRGKEQLGKGLGVTWEGSVITQELYDAQRKNIKFIPVVLNFEGLAHIPITLRGATSYDLSKQDDYDALYRRLTHQPAVVMSELGEIQSKPPRLVKEVLPELLRKQDFAETAPAQASSKTSQRARALHFFEEVRALIIWLISGGTALIRFLRGTADLSEQLLLVLALIAAWIASIYVARSKSTTQVILTDGHSQAHVYQRWLRRTAGIFAVLLPSATIGWFVWQEYKPFPKDQIKVLVADFEQDSSQHYRITKTIVEELRKASQPYVEARVEHLRQFISWDEGSAKARAEAKKRRANIILWGDCDSTKQRAILTVHVELLGRLPSIPLYGDSGEVVNVSLDDVESFTVQSEIAAQTRYLVLLVLGSVRFQVKDYQGAIDRLSDALASDSVPSKLLDPGAIYFMRGLAYENLNKYDHAISDYDALIRMRPTYAGAYKNRAVFYTEAGDQDRAIADCDSAIRLDSNDPELYANRGAAFLKKNDFAHSLDDFNVAIKLSPGKAGFFNSRGVAHERLNQFELALADLNAAIGIAPDYANPYHNRGNVRNEKKEFDLAIADFSRAIAIDPNGAAASYYGRGNAYLGKKDVANALADFKEATTRGLRTAGLYLSRGLAYDENGETDRAISDFNEALALKSDYAEAYNNRGVAYRNRGEFDAAILDFRRALRLKPGFVHALNNMGVAHWNKGEYDVAVSWFDHALRVDPNYADAFNNRGLSFESKGEVGKAIADFSKAIQIHPDDVDANVNLGFVEISRGGWGVAMAAFDHAIKVAPTNANAHRGRGVVYEETGKPEEAIKEFGVALQLNPKDSWAYYGRAKAYCLKGAWEASLADFNSVVQMEPKLAAAFHDRGVAFAKIGNLNQAIADFTEAIRLAPDFTSAYRNRGRAYGESQKYGLAVSDFSHVIRSNAKDPELYNSRGYALYCLGKLDEAIADFNRSIALKPDFAHAYFNRANAYASKGDTRRAAADYSRARSLGLSNQPSRGMNCMLNGSCALSVQA